jgi:hypothetical protein
MSGSTGHDLLRGRDGGDALHGSTGNDTLEGRDDADYLSGSSGNDVLDGGPAADTLSGPSGTDSLRLLGRHFILARDGVRDVVDCGTGDDHAVVDLLDDVVACELVDRPVGPAPAPGAVVVPPPQAAVTPRPWKPRAPRPAPAPHAPDTARPAIALELAGVAADGPVTAVVGCPASERDGCSAG